VTVERRSLPGRHDEGEGALGAEVVELPGCFATGHAEDALVDHVLDAIALVLDVERSDLDRVEWGERVDVEAVRELRGLDRRFSCGAAPGQNDEIPPEGGIPGL
jgi:hypothetical protein